MPPEAWPSGRPHWPGTRERLRGGSKAHGRSDDAKHAGSFKVTRAVRSTVLIGPESVVIGSDRSVRVEKAKRERAITGPRRRPLGWNCRYKNVTPNSRLFADTTWPGPASFVHIEHKLEGVRDLADDFDTGAGRERIMNDAGGGDWRAKGFDRLEHRPPRRAAAFLRVYLSFGNVSPAPGPRRS
jgi:hypothetical protein